MQQGFFSIQQTCPRCRGKGKTIRVPCDYCRGTGLRRVSKKLSVKIPAGVDSGDRIRLTGEGEAGPDHGPPGDLYVQVLVREHELFTRQASDLCCEVPVSFSMAALGGEVEVPTLKGRLKLKIPAGTQTGRVFRLRGEGVKPVRGTSVGDMLCSIVVETPVNLNRKQQELLRQFASTLEEGGSHHSPRSHTWTGSVKSFFENLRFWSD